MTKKSFILPDKYFDTQKFPILAKHILDKRVFLVDTNGLVRETLRLNLSDRKKPGSV